MSRCFSFPPPGYSIKLRLDLEKKLKLQMGEDYETDQLEKSDITEELDQPVSDSSQTSKRKRSTLLPNQDHGPAIRTRLPLRKHREPLQNSVPVDDESRRVESLYKYLLHIHPITCERFDSLDQDWLFSSLKSEAKPVSKKQKIDAFQCSKSLWPRAQFMHEFDIYALPYTIPF